MPWGDESPWVAVSLTGTVLGPAAMKRLPHISRRAHARFSVKTGKDWHIVVARRGDLIETAKALLGGELLRVDGRLMSRRSPSRTQDRGIWRHEILADKLLEVDGRPIPPPLRLPARFREMLGL